MRGIVKKYGYDAVTLAARLFMAQLFFMSGWLKFKNLLDHNWNATVYLFEAVHPVPGISAGLAAVMFTAGELCFSVMLGLGMKGKAAAIGLIALTLLMHLALRSPEHVYWLLILALLLCTGMGSWTLGALRRRI